MKTDQNQTLADGALGVPALIFLVISAVGPITTLFGNMILVMQFGNGIGATGVYIVAMVVWLLFSVGFAAMVRHIRNTGAFYAFIARGLGRLPGVSASYLAILAYVSTQISALGMIGYAINAFLALQFDIHLSWWIYSLIAWALVTILGYRHIEIGAKILGVLMLGEVVVMVIFSIASILHPSSEGYTAAPFNPEVIFNGHIGLAFLFSFGSFIGFEAAAVFSEEAKNSRRSVPIATYSAVIIMTVLYALASYALIVGWDGVMNRMNQAFNENGNADVIIYGLVTRVLGGPAVIVMQVLLITSVFAVLLALHNMITRYYFSGGRTGVLPPGLGKIHRRFRSPHIASIVQSVIAFIAIVLIAVSGANPYMVYGWFSAIGILSLLLLYTFTSIAVIAYFARSKVDTRLWHTKIAPALATIGLGYATVYAVLNFDVLIGEGHMAITIAIFLIILAVAITGIAVGFRLRKHRPDLYEKIGVTVPEPENNNIPSGQELGLTEQGKG
ncbi:amino acid/polyamine/organocation transporter (APC superfamily) [Scopulibacillus darangshiensis]|uniref:Amino acid/polyamine/organocation transporter (APC superfamily) n=1 Tax=Scopulibacillus darangshiensis TaxID=442528 RepID=A0A4V2SMM5_9BACL|nr:APC family permease [Scopulibacillus darangshiensis]TCP27826.1 amino acid/polyamine/organocation transporter (APC superfamily) [Scopulibacillus darangshiensis]